MAGEQAARHWAEEQELARGQEDYRLAKEAYEKSLLGRVSKHAASARNRAYGHASSAHGHVSQHLAKHARKYKAAGALAALAAIGYGAHRLHKKHRIARRNEHHAEKHDKHNKNKHNKNKHNKTTHTNKKMDASLAKALDTHCNGEKRAGTICNPSTGRFVKKDGPTGRKVIAKYGR